MPGAIEYVHLLSELDSATFTDLRPAQVAALERYSADHSATPDLAIELPTGAGKSLIALLIWDLLLFPGVIGVVVGTGRRG
jgi:replicative superfamily II helicase